MQYQEAEPEYLSFVVPFIGVKNRIKTGVEVNNR